MSKQPSTTPGPCNPACTNTIKFMTDNALPPSIGISLPPLHGYWWLSLHQYLREV